MAVLGGLLLVGLYGSARAETGTTSTSALSWVRLPGAGSCIGTAELGSRVEAHLGRRVFATATTADVSIEGHVEPRGHKFTVTLGGARRDGTSLGTRELESEGPDCRTLDAGLVLVIALMIDPDAIGATPAPIASPTAAAAAPGPATVTREGIHETTIVREIHHDAPAAAPWRVDAHLDGSLGFGRLPALAPGVLLAIEFGPWKRFPIQVTLGTSATGAVSYAERSASFLLVEGGVGMCPGLPLGRRVELGGCAAVRAGGVRSVGRGFEREQAVERGLVDVVAGPRVALTVAGPVFAIATASAVVPLVRQRTTFTGLDGAQIVLHERALLGAELIVGIGVHFSP